MNIENIENYYSFFERLIELFPAFGNALDGVEETFEFKDFLEIVLDNVYSTAEELEEDTENVVIKKKRKFVKVYFADEIITFIYSSLIKLEETKKVKGISVSKNFIQNIKGIMNNKTHIHHSHITGEIIGYSHSYCNQKSNGKQIKNKCNCS